MSELWNPTAGLDIATGLAELRKDVDNNTDIVRYIDWLEYHYGLSPAVEMMVAFSSLPDLASIAQGSYDPEHRAGPAFLQGSYLGIRAVELGNGSPILGDIQQYDLPIPAEVEQSDSSRWRIAAAIALQEEGNEGYGLAEPIRDKLDEWDLRVTRDVRTGIFFKRGFGFVLHAAHQVAREKAATEFESMMVASDIDQKEWGDLETLFTDYD